MLRVVTVVALAAVAVWAAGRFLDAGPQQAARVFRTNAGEQSTLRLSDGTRVVLNVASELRISSSFREGARDVYLEGEAYFEVTTRAGRPFHVHAGGAVARVLGTAFDVRAYPEDGSVAVVVSEGRVAVGASTAAAPADTLTRSEMGRLSRGPSGGPTVVENVDIDRRLGWLDGRLVFENAPVGEVVAQLERWYALDVELAGSKLAGRHLTGSFTDEPVEEVLRIVALSLGARYKKDGRHVVFFSAGEG